MPPLPLSHTPTDLSASSQPPAALADTLLSPAKSPLENLTGALLGYWGRERLAGTTQMLVSLSRPLQKLLDDPDALAQMNFLGYSTAPSRSKRAIFSYPAQAVGHDLLGSSAVFCVDANLKAYRLYLHEIDPTKRTVTLSMPPDALSDGFTPDRCILDTWVSPHPKPDRLAGFAERLLAGASLPRVSLDILEKSPPRFVPRGGPKDSVFVHDELEAASWIEELDSSYVVVQGPPGAGKTYLGAWLIYCLIKAGRKVAITSMSHAAAENLLRAVVDVFDDHQEIKILRAAKKGATPGSKMLPGVSYLTRNSEVLDANYNLIVGTTWLFASAEMVSHPVDTLFVDEAGQLSLADAVVASLSAKNLVLLGDPRQLAQVSLGEHPFGSGASVLEHVLGPTGLVTPTRGLFLPETYRMHPEITTYISETFYDAKLSAHYTCEIQNSSAGVGLRFLGVTHRGHVSSAPEEVTAILEEITRLLRTPWTNSNGSCAPLAPKDFMVITPFNDQVDLFHDSLSVRKDLAGVRVGTVDRFQGQESPVVFYSLATSNRALAHRGVQFLFSPNRLNVALSRARVLSYLVASPDLLVPSTSNDPDPDLIDNLTSFLARATHI